MEPVAAPLLLDPDRIVREDREDMTTEDHRSQAQILEKALHESCAYAQQLWNDVASMRQYLFDSLPEAGSGSGVAPTCAEDEAGWSRWSDAFAELTSVLCGPSGDEGYGRETATQLATVRRSRTG